MHALSKAAVRGVLIKELRTKVQSEEREISVQFEAPSPSAGSISLERARAILGENFFGPVEGRTHFKLLPGDFTAHGAIPFTEEELHRDKKTHILVAAPELSILEMQERMPLRLFTKREDAFYRSETFAQERGIAGWYLIRKNLVTGSKNRSLAEQFLLLRPEEEVPRARVLVYASIGYHLATGKHLFDDGYVRCADVRDHARQSIIVSHFKGHGIDINHYWPDIRSERIGIASEKSQSLV